MHESDLAAIFARNQWSTEMFQDFLDQIHSPSAFSQAHVSGHLEAQIGSILDFTWFQMKGMPTTMTATAAGTKPGDSIADLLFGFLMTRYMRTLHQAFAEHGLHNHFTLRWIPPCDLEPHEQYQTVVSDAAWVDDLVLSLTASSPDILIAKATVALTLVYDIAVSFGLHLNMNKDKTSLLLALRGPNARTTWKSLLATDPQHPTLTFPSRAHDAPVSVVIVPDYMYLGSLHDHSGFPTVDVKRRFLAIQAIRKLLRRGVFKSQKVPLKTKSLLFQTLVVSRLTFSCGAWQPMHMLTARSWQTQLVNLYSQIHADFKRGPHVHNLDIVAMAKQLHPMMLLATSRLQLYDRVLQTEMTPLFALLQDQSQQSGWLAMICQDILQMSQYVSMPSLQSLAQQLDHAELAHVCFRAPKRLSKLAHKAKLRYMRHLDLWNDFRKFQKAFDDDASCFGATWTDPEPMVTQVRNFECTHCQKTFADHHALCTHVYKMHNIINIAHRYALSHRCRACMKQYDSQDSLIHHLKYFRTGCLVKLILTTFPLETDELDAIMHESKQLRKQKRQQQRVRHHRMPVVRAAGPLLPWPWDKRSQYQMHDNRDPIPINDQQMDQWISDVLHALEGCEVSDVYLTLMHQSYHGSLATRLLAAFAEFHEALRVPPSPGHAEKLLILQEAICLWQDSTGVPMQRLAAVVQVEPALTALRQVRMPREPQDPEHNMQDRRQNLLQELWSELTVPTQIAAHLQHIHARQWTWPAPHSLQITQEPVFLYVYSGRRREGDVQSHLEAYFTQFSLRAKVLLIDLALSPHHDATNDTLVARLLQWFKAGAIAGLLIAPPCETWTEARYNELPGENAPRPVRTAAHPFGIQDLTMRSLNRCRSHLCSCIPLYAYCWRPSWPAHQEWWNTPKSHVWNLVHQSGASRGLDPYWEASSWNCIWSGNPNSEAGRLNQPTSQCVICPDFTMSCTPIASQWIARGWSRCRANFKMAAGKRQLLRNTLLFWTEPWLTRWWNTIVIGSRIRLITLLTLLILNAFSGSCMLAMLTFRINSSSLISLGSTEHTNWMSKYFYYIRLFFFSSSRGTDRHLTEFHAWVSRSLAGFTLWQRQRVKESHLIGVFTTTNKSLLIGQWSVMLTCGPNLHQCIFEIITDRRPYIQHSHGSATQVREYVQNV